MMFRQVIISRTYVFIFIFGLLWMGEVEQVNAQTKTPFSYFGIGDLRSTGFVQNNAMGDLAYGLRSPRNVNILNPAAHSALDWTAFEFAFRAKQATLLSEDYKQKNFNATPAYLSLGFPVLDRWGASFGLVPFNDVSYNVIDREPYQNGDSITYRYQGEGNLYRFYLGNGINVVPLKGEDGNHTLALGGNVSYVFGTIQKEEALEYPIGAQVFNVRRTSALSVSDFLFDAGFQYDFRFNEEYHLTIGAMTTFQEKLFAEKNNLWEQYEVNQSGSGVQTIDIKDTVRIDTTDGRVIYPMQIGGGITISKEDHWVFGVDVRYGEWSEFKLFNETQGLSDNLRVALGGEVIPDPNAVSNYLKLVNYRFGAFYESGYINVENTTVPQFGMTFGVGLPVKKLFSTVNLSFEIGQQGILEDNGIRESYFKTTLGFTFNDQWFVKRKID